MSTDRIKSNKHRIGIILLTVTLLIPVFSLCMVNGYCNGLNCVATDEVRPGASFTVKVVMDTPAIGYEGWFSYDPTRVTLTRAIPINSNLYTEFHISTEDGHVRVEHQEPVKQMLQFTFAVSSKVAIGETVSVYFFQGRAYGEDYSEPVNDQTCNVAVTSKKSSDATLSSVTLSVYESEQDRDQDRNPFIASLSPKFSAKKYSYSVTIPGEYAFYGVNALTNDANATATVSETKLVAGEVNEVTSLVTAEDGTKETYTLRVFREQKTGIGSDDSSEDSSVVSEDSSLAESEPDDSSVADVSEQEPATVSETDSEASDVESEESADSQAPTSIAPIDPEEIAFDYRIILLIVAILAFIASIVFSIVLQCQKAAARKAKDNVGPDIHTLDYADDQIKNAREKIEDGLLNAMRQNFADTVPESVEDIISFLTNLFVGCSSRRYIQVEALTSYMDYNPCMFLRGPDAIGGLSVLSIHTDNASVNGSVFLEGLTIGFRQDDFMKTETYSIRFLTGKTGDPIEKLLVFEQEKTE